MDESRFTISTSATGQSSLTSSIPPAKTLPFPNLSEEFLRPSKRPRLEPFPPMTAAAAAADAIPRMKSPLSAPSEPPQTSPNPATEAQKMLMGLPENAISKAYTPVSKAPQSAAPATGPGPIRVTEPAQTASSDGTANASGDSYPQTSPISTSSFDGQDSIVATSGVGTTVASPQPMETNSQLQGSGGGPDLASAEDGSKTASYPAPHLQPHSTDIRRGASLPYPRRDTRSPSSKKHQCPFCKTEFTRHHNLKSHLLTHSQEKPYVCSTCSSRFRRLHDLKRHTKLHTGERPHVCPKCNRKFARGDALARHSKGPGGCAGRRASMGSFGGDDDDMDGNDDSMDGVMYGEPESMEDIEDSSAKGTPAIRRQAPSGDDTMDDAEQYSRTPSTYPPIQGRPAGGIASGVYPPRSNYPPAPPIAPGAPTQGHGQTLYPSTGSGSTLRPSSNNSVFAQNPLTESPKPISPRQPHRGSGPTDTRMQSPSVPPFQPPPGFTRSHSGSGPSHATQTTGPQLPPPHVLNPPDTRFTLASQGGPTHPPTQPSGPPTHMGGSGPLSSHSNSLSSHGASGPGSGDAGSMFNKDDRIWAYVRTIENRMEAMQEEINSLKAQIAASNMSQQARA